MTHEQLRRSAEPQGFFYGETFHPNFEDDPDLPLSARRRVAAWARALTPHELSPAQRDMLDHAVPQPSKAQLEARELGSDLRTPLWETLTDAERQLALTPERHPEIGRTYPLTVSQLATLANLSERQIRHWTEMGLLPARRDGDGRRRLFYRAAAIRAFAYGRMGYAHLTVLRELANGDPSPMLAGMATVIHERAAHASGDSKPLIELADKLEQASAFIAQEAEPA